MLFSFVHFAALASLSTANPYQLYERQVTAPPISDDHPSLDTTSSNVASVGASSMEVSGFVAPPSATFASPAGSSAPSADNTSIEAIVFPSNATFASATGSSVASILPSPSEPPTAAGSDAPTASSDNVSGSPAPTAVASSADTNPSAAVGELPGVYTTTFLIDEDPFPITRTIVQTITRPQAPASTLLDGAANGILINTVFGNEKIGGQGGLASQIVALSTSADGSTETQTLVPQPPVPSKTASADDAVFTPNGFDTSTTPKTREYTFDIEYTAGAPDGFLRRVTTVNGLFPGPLIEANRGDKIVVHVNNKLDNGRTQSIHWHGMRQHNTPHMDGVPGITQCPIAAGKSYTYEFTLDTEMGTYWWHSHSGNSQADGVSGGLIVHAPDEPYQKGRDYDEERMVYLQDWMRDQSDDILDGITSNLRFRNSTVVGAPDSSLVNGVGQTVCGEADPSRPCGQTEPRTMTIPLGKTRFRVINMGSHAMYRVSIDRHVLKVIEVDDTPIRPVDVHEIPLHPGQRYSFIVETNAGVAGDKFFFRSRLATNCMARNDREQEQKMIIRYAGDGGREAADQPWGDLMGRGNRCEDLDSYVNLIPVGIPAVPQDSFAIDVFNTQAGVITNHRGQNITGFRLNQTSYVNFVNKPILRDVIEGRDFNHSAIPSVSFSGPTNSSVDIIINSLDADRLSHPFHLHSGESAGFRWCLSDSHSRPFYIIARGSGVMTPNQLNGVNVNLDNPLRRDVITLAGQEWAVLRVPSDTPVGKLGVVIMQPELLRQQVQLPGAWQDLCAGRDEGEIDAGRRRRRSLPPQVRNLKA